MILGCEDSDGLKGYDFSHNGYFKRFQPSTSSGRRYIGEESRIEDCASQCDEDPLCDAFHYEPSISRPGRCVVYYDMPSAEEKGYSQYHGNTKAYIKCKGKS